MREHMQDSAPSADPSTLRFLVIDDNPDDAFLVTHALKRRFPGGSFSVTSDRIELQNLISSGERFDIILSDWAFPQFNGLEALAMIREAGIDTPFIIVSGKIGEEAAIRAIRSGAYDYVLKDDLGRLPGAIQHALEAHLNEIKAKSDASLIALQATALGVAPAAIAVANPAGLLEWVNPAFESLTGYSAGEVLGRELAKCFSDLGCPSCADMLDSGTSRKEYVCRGLERTKSGKLYFEERKICPVFDQDGVLTHLVITKEDVTDSEQEKKSLEMEVHLGEVLRQSLTPETLCARTIQIIQLHFSDIETGIMYRPDAADGKIRWFGTRDNDPRTSEATRVFRRDFGETEGNVSFLYVRYSAATPFDMERVLADFFDKFNSGMERLEAERKISIQLGNISFLKRIGRTLSSQGDTENALVPLLRSIRSSLKSDAVALYLFERGTTELTCRAHDGFQTTLVEHARIRLGQPYVGIAAEEQRLVVVDDFSSIDRRSQFWNLIETERFCSQHCSPIVAGGKTIGVLEVFNRRITEFPPSWNLLYDAISAQTGLALDYSMIYGDLQKAYVDLQTSYEATIEGWSQAMDYRDQETEGHSRRVTSLLIALAKRLGYEPQEIDRMKRGATLHDIGKIGIPDSVLKKNGPLDESEWVLMKRHPLIAHDMLSRIPYLRDSLDIPLHHHERWDGTGYPHQLAGEEIPVAARLFAIVDVYDALTSDRPYRKAWTKEDTLEYLRTHAGTQFDPVLAEEFVRMIEE